MATFPLLSTGAVTQYPSQKEISFQTTVAHFVDGSEQRFRTSRGNVKRWLLRMSHITAEEMCALEEFFDSARGQFSSFSFVDPWNGIEYPDCSFDTDQLEISAANEWRWAARIVIRNNEI
jgi:hypothetical protein